MNTPSKHEASDAVVRLCKQLQNEGLEIEEIERRVNELAGFPCFSWGYSNVRACEEDNLNWLKKQHPGMYFAKYKGEWISVLLYCDCDE